jgi:predicted transcriptional regulator
VLSWFCVVVTLDWDLMKQPDNSDNMPAPTISKEQWARVRAIWEADPVITFQEIADNLGITRQGVRQRATREKWQKGIDAIAIEGKVHRIADSKVTENARDVGTQDSDVYGSDPKVKPREPELDRSIPAIPDGTPPHQVTEIVRDAAEAKRVALIERHRHELGAIRAQLYGAVKKAGTKDGLTHARTAKTLVEAFSGLQQAERAAWGMSAGGGKGGKDEPPPAATIIVHQHEGGKLV